jgi:predicted DNA-binding protein YlxM (UPF0122 family)
VKYAKFMEQARQRNDQIVNLYLQGVTQQDIADIFLVSRQRIQQVLKKRKIKAKDGGSKLKVLERQEELTGKRETKCREMYGCSWRDYHRFRRRWKNYRLSPIYRFRNHKNGSRLRGIEWKLTLFEWWNIWKKSGKWKERGRSPNQYQMARFKDIGPYSVENVRIITGKQNKDEYYLSPGNKKKHGQLIKVGHKEAQERRAAILKAKEEQARA